MPDCTNGAVLVAVDCYVSSVTMLRMPASAAKSKSPPPNAVYLTVAEVAERLRTPPETVRYWVHMRRLRAFRPGRKLLFLSADVDAFVAAHPAR